jgi:hypothetical protein
MGCPEYQGDYDCSIKVRAEVTALLDSMLLVAALVAMAIHFGFWR